MNDRDSYDDRYRWAGIATALIGVTVVVVAFVLMVTVPEQIEAVAEGLTRPLSTGQSIIQTDDPTQPTPTQKPVVAQILPTIITIAPTIERTVEPERERTDVVRVPQATPTLEQTEQIERAWRVEEIGRSVEDRAIERYSFGRGAEQMTFVGGIHGGYEWNSVALAYRLIWHLQENLDTIPDSMTIHVVPAFNPDGLFLALGQEGEIEIPDPATLNVEDYKRGRFNANSVDLNRNWDCVWQQNTQWIFGTVPMGGGTEPFSEPETKALKAHFEEGEHIAAVFWHSFAKAVYPGSCGEPFERSNRLSEVYAEAADYVPKTVFQSYTVTGTAGSWLATIGIPSIAVELETQENVEWERNLAGVLAIIDDNAP